MRASRNFGYLEVPNSWFRTLKGWQLTQIGMMAGIMLILLPLQLSAEDPTHMKNGGYQLKASTFGSAGINGASGGIEIRGTFAQTSPIGRGSSSGGELEVGFWPVASATGFVSPVHEIPQPLETKLNLPSPNPFNPATKISFSLSKAGPVALVIYDIAGRRVNELVHEERSAGNHQIMWYGKDEFGRSVASGPYFCRLETEEYVKVVKMLLVK